MSSLSQLVVGSQVVVIISAAKSSSSTVQFGRDRLRVTVSSLYPHTGYARLTFTVLCSSFSWSS